MLWIEGLVALGFALAFLLHAFVAFKPEHVEHHPMRVRVGALIQGLTLGLLVGFVIVPLRMGYMEFRGVDMPAGWSSLSFLPALLILIMIRRGALLKAPVISTYLRAYRRATLLKARDDAVKQLAKLDEIEGRRHSP
jgi:MFS superfamily sulfate permease-like transporter